MKFQKDFIGFSDVFWMVSTRRFPLKPKHTGVNEDTTLVEALAKVLVASW